MLPPRRGRHPLLTLMLRDPSPVSPRQCLCLQSNRRNGIGRALLRRLEAALIETGCLKVNLQVRSSNMEVIAFYEKLGYALEDRVSMGKRLY